MPSEASVKVRGSPLPSVTPPRLQSPSKSRLSSKLAQSITQGDDEDQLFVTQLNDTPSTLDLRRPESSDDGTTVFLTEANLRELDAINEEDFEDDIIDDDDERETRTGDDIDGFSRESRNTGVSGVSSLSENDQVEADYDTDLELESAEKWLHPELFDRDTTGVNRYLRMCQKLDIQPITYFLKHMQDTELVMKYHGLGPRGVKAMSDPLEINTTIERMDLEGNYILGVGATYLSKVLKDNVYVTELILSENKIGNEGASAICDLLLENKTITYLDLKGNNIEDGVAEDFYDMLSRNTDLKTLILRHNSFEDEGAKHLKEALIDNDTLVSLDLSWNHFRWKGCVSIAEGLQENQGLKQIDLCMNGFGLEGSKALEDALRQNHTLTDLNVSFCRIPLEGAPHFAAGLQHNDTLEILNIGYNPIQSEGGYVMLVGVDRNENTCLKHLNFGNLTVKPDFKKLSDSLEDERKMTIIYGNVMLDVTSFRNRNYDPWAAHVNDPMTILKEWLDKTGYRLVDLLFTFDRTKTLTISLTELKEGIKANGIQMNDAQCEILMQKLDADNSGEIDMKELMQGDELHTLAKREAEKFKDEQDTLDKERRASMKAGDAKSFQKIIQQSDVVKPVAVV